MLWVILKYALLLLCILGACVLVGLLLLVILFAFAEISSVKAFRKKFGHNYNMAMSNEFCDVECKPYPCVISRKLIREKYCAGIDLPQFRVIKCISHMRHFTGDTSETVYIEFETLPDQSIFTSCRDLIGIYLDNEGVRHAVIRYFSNDDMMEWSVDMPENSCSARISYMTM